jgi:hypothetical protein
MAVARRRSRMCPLGNTDGYGAIAQAFEEVHP